MPTHITLQRKCHASETDEQWKDVLDVSETMIHMNEIVSESNEINSKPSFVTSEKKKANPYRTKTLLKHPSGCSDSFKCQEAKAHLLNKEANRIKVEQRFKRDMEQFCDDIDDNELLCMDIPIPQSDCEKLV